MKRFGAAAMLLAIVSVPRAQQSTTVHAEDNRGVIQGTVIYDDGGPVIRATVYALPMDRSMAGIVPQTIADESGHFVISHLPLGKYAVRVEKLSEGFIFFDTVVLTASNLAASLHIQGSN
jgi:Carboxypeptidase regulatory-like domain